MAGGRRRIRGAEVLDLLSSLVDKSLVAVEDTADGQRYRLLETVREYLKETHGGTAEAARVRMRHRKHFVELTKAMEPKLIGGGAAAAMDLLETEHDNIRAAQDDALSEDPPDALRIINSVARFWAIRGYWIEGIDRTNRALDATRSLSDSAESAGALLCAGRLLMLSGSYYEAERDAAKGLAIYESHGQLRDVARAHLLLGTIATNQGDFDRSMRHLEASRELYQQLGMRDQLPFVANNMGIAHAHAGQFEMAARYFEESIEIVRANGGKTSHTALNNISIIRFGLCDYERATECCEEALQIATELGDRQATANCSHILGAIACSRGEFVEARRLLTHSIAMADAIGFLTLACDGRLYLSMAVFELGLETEARSHLTLALKGFVKTKKHLEIVRSLMAGALLYGDPRLIGAADRLQEEEKVVLTQDDLRRFESYRERLRSLKGDGTFREAVGDRVSIDDAVRIILDGQ